MTSNFVTCHCHIQSLDSASSPEKFAEREVELGTGYIACTDHGSLEATRLVYDMCAKGGAYHGKLTPILGVEAYFRDDSCPILTANGVEALPDKDSEGNLVKMTFRDYFKYAHITLHAQDEAAFFAMSKRLSDADLDAEKHGSERKPLFDWADLEALGQMNVTGTSGCLIGMVGRHLMDNNDPKMAVRYYEKLRSVFKPGNFFVELMPHATDKNWTEEVVITYEGGETERFAPWKNLKTDSGTFKAEELAKSFARSGKATCGKINEVMQSRKWVPVQSPRTVVGAVYRSGFYQNECRPWCADGDYQKDLNRFLYALATKYGDPILVSDDSHFATPDEKVVQDVRLMQHGGSWRFSESHHRMSSAEAWANFSTKLGCSEAQFSEWVENTHNWAARFKDFKFSSRPALPTNFYPPDSLAHIKTLIDKHGRMKWDDPRYVARLEQEIELLHRNGTIDLLPYPMPFEEICDLYRKNRKLVGSGRGSAAGVLLSYLLAITHADPLMYDLSLDRFITPDRVATGKLPDIDQDLPSRDLLVDPNDPEKGWLKERFGSHVAQLSTDTKLKLKSAIRDVHRALYGRVDSDVEAIAKSLADPPQGIDSHDHVFGYEDDVGAWVPGQIETDPKLQNYVKLYPKEWETVQKCLGLTRSRGRHPCAFVISPVPVDSFIPMTTIGGVRVTSFTHAAVEAMGGLKLDFLTVNSVNDVGVAIDLIQRRRGLTHLLEHGYQTINGKSVHNMQVIPVPSGGYADIYELPNDPAVYKDICLGKVETVFQLDAPAAKDGLKNFRPVGDELPLNSIEGLAAFTALDRPGPLDAYVTDEAGNSHNMLVEYARRARGEIPVGAMPILDRMLPETYGVIVFQEQLTKIFQEVGGATGIQAQNFRGRISKKKMVEVDAKDRPLFMAGAVPKLGQAEAERLWSAMATFGQYGFNKSHAVCYMLDAYACSYIKHYYPLEWWCAVLQNASRNDVNEKFWKYVSHLVLPPDIRKSSETFVIEGDKLRAPLWMVSGIGEKAQEHLTTLSKCDTIEDVLQSIEDHKDAHQTTVMKVDKKTGEEKLAIRRGTSPIGDAVLKKLIICGIMDSMFPATDADGLPMTVTDRLTAFETAAVKVRKLKKYKGATAFAMDSHAAQYQYKKSVMPCYSEDLLPIVRELGKGVVQKSGKGFSYQGATLITGRQYDYLANLTILPPSNICVAVPVYVMDQRVFEYDQKKTGRKAKACDLTVDTDGVRYSVVKWPGRDGLEKKYTENLIGSVGVLLLERSDASRPFFLTEYHMLVEPLVTQKEESSA